MREFLIPPGMTFWQALQKGMVPAIESDRYKAFVGSLPCVLTGQPAHVHHLVGHGLKPVGGKTSDFLSFPLAPELHVGGRSAIHVVGHKVWEQQYGDQRVFVMQTLFEAAARGFFKVVPSP